jgi:hypothetical protein
VISSVSPLRTTATDWGSWPVRCCWKVIAARAICCATLGSSFSIALRPRRGSDRLTGPRTKKADVAEHLKVFDHVGLLVNEPSGKAGLPFI